MSYYIRKIQRSYWDEYPPQDSYESTFTPIFINCLKPSDDHELSIWKIDDLDDSKINDAVLAICLNRNNIPPRIDFVAVDENEIKEFGLSLNEKAGTRKFPSFSKNHRNIEEVTFDVWHKVALAITKAIDDDRGKFRTKKQIVKIFRDAITDGKIDKNHLKEKLREEIDV